MQWWASVWDGIAKFFGYEQWLWGSAAEWLGAIGTAGAFLFGFLLLARDRRKDEQQHADALTVAIRWETGSSLGGGRTYTLVVYMHNASDRPIPVLWITYQRADAKGTPTWYRLPVNQGHAEPVMLDPRKSSTVRIGGFDGPELPVIYVEFSDTRGKQWVRDIRTNEYLSDNKAKKVLAVESKYP